MYCELNEGMGLMFWLRKILARALFPVPVVFELLVLGAILVRFRRTKKAGVGLVAAGLLVLGLGSQPAVGNRLLASLERQHHALDAAALDAGTNYVIGVAGNGLRICGPGCSGCFNDCFLVRLQEAGRIGHIFESRGIEYQLVVSCTGDMTTGQKNAVLEQYFVSFGIPRERLVLEEESFNSRMEVEAFGRYAGQLILVSNAYHVPRLMKLAELDDLEALAAPAGWRVSSGGFGVGIPSAEALEATRLFVYERLGMLFP